MPTASLEALLELWSTSLRDAKDQLRPLFAAPSVACSAGAFLEGLLGAERRKTGWMRAEAAGDPGPWRQQAVLGRSQWDADALRDVVREHVVETLAEPDAVLTPSWSSTRLVFSSRVKLPAVSIASIRARPVRSPTARSACSQLTSRPRGMPSSIAPSTCRRLDR